MVAMGLLLSVLTAPIAVSMALQEVGAGRGRTRQGAPDAGGGFVVGRGGRQDGEESLAAARCGPGGGLQKAVADQNAKPRDRASVASDAGLAPIGALADPLREICGAGGDFLTEKGHYPRAGCGAPRSSDPGRPSR